jgi:hypothetical protein
MIYPMSLECLEIVGYHTRPFRYHIEIAGSDTLETVLLCIW